MNSVCSALMYRSKELLTSAAASAICRRSPRTARVVAHAKKLASSALSRRRFWVQVRRGPAAGAWMHLQLPLEGGYWSAAHEPDLQKIIAKVVGTGQVTYDVGAHLGYITAAMAQSVGPTGHVVAFEADGHNVSRLREHVERNGWTGRVEVLEKAVWEESLSAIPFRRGGTLTSRGGIEHGDISPVLGSGDVVQVPAISIDDVAGTSVPGPDFIKVDVEGAEAEVLRGSTETVCRYRPILAVEVHHAEARARIEQWLLEVPYNAEWIIPPQGFPRLLLATPPSSARDPRQPMGHAPA